MGWPEPNSTVGLAEGETIVISLLQKTILDKILTHQKTFPEMSKPPAIFIPRWGENAAKIKPHRPI